MTIMMNYIVLYVGNAFIHAFPKDIMQSTDSTIRVSANATYQTPWLSELTGNSRMNIGIFFAIIAVGVIWFLLKKTTLGFEIRAVGLNPHASEYAGISAKRTIILSMIISGALAGLGGAVEGLGTFQNVYVQGSSLAIGFNGMAVSLLAGNSPIGILFAAFLFGVLQVGAPGMNAAQVPSELVSIVTASIIFFVSVHYIIERFVKPKNKLKEVSGMSITTLLTLLVSSMLIYSAPLILRVLEESSLNVVVSLMSVLKELWLWEPLLGLSLTLNLQNNLEQLLFGFLLVSCWYRGSYFLPHPCSSYSSFPCGPCCQWYSIELDGSCPSSFLG